MVLQSRRAFLLLMLLDMKLKANPISHQILVKDEFLRLQVLYIALEDSTLSSLKWVTSEYEMNQYLVYECRVFT